MSSSYDVLLKAGKLVDPVNQRNGLFDIGIIDGKISEISSDISPTLAKQVFDIEGLHVVPGIIDLHVHVSLSASKRAMGHKMMAEAGVTTALDMAGPIERVLDGARDYGAGINLACIHQIRPGYSVEKFGSGSTRIGVAAYGFDEEGRHRSKDSWRPLSTDT